LTPAQSDRVVPCETLDHHSAWRYLYKPITKISRE
jgi:hypothetical protein